MTILVLPLAMLGALVRWQLAERLNGLVPVGTLIANTAASFAVGLFSNLEHTGDLLIRVGLLGALSTWSTLAHEVAVLARLDEGRLALGYLLSTTGLGVGAAFIGLQLAA